MACSWARLVRETGYKTPDTGVTLNTHFTVLELLDDDPVTVEQVPANEQLYSWQACGDPDRAIGETAGIQGSIRTLVYPPQAPMILGWAFQKVSGSSPWTTTEPAGQFASMALDYAYRDDSGTERKDRYTGGKVTRARLSADRNTRNGAFMLELDVTFSERITSPASAPVNANLPTGAPYFLSATSGGILVNGQTISDYESIVIEANYTTSARFDESATVRRIRHHRTEARLEIGGLLKFSPDWRALRDARSTFASSVRFNYPGGTGQQQLNFAMPKARVADDGWSKALPIANDRTQTLNVLAEFDRVTGNVFTLGIAAQ